MNHNRTQIKICGVKSPNIAYASGKLGVHYIGMIFHSQSKRNVDLKIARSISESAKRTGATPVAVFVNQTAKEIVKICSALEIDVVQLHGEQAREQHDQLPQHIVRIYVLPIDRLSNVIKQKNGSMAKLKVERDYILFDGPCGGSGKCIVTDRINEIAGKFKFFVAGGLTENNVGKTIERCNPYAIDVSTGVENQIGEKDLSLIKKFVLQVN